MDDHPTLVRGWTESRLQADSPSTWLCTGAFTSTPPPPDPNLTHEDWAPLRQHRPVPSQLHIMADGPLTDEIPNAVIGWWAERVPHLKTE
jgi:hypothetical protein